jgi:hypothetical protein
MDLAAGWTDAQPAQIEVWRIRQSDPGRVHLKRLNSASSATHHRKIAFPT